MKISIFSPAASEPLGHPLYAQKLSYYLSRDNDIQFYTLEHSELNEELRKNGAKVQTTTLFEVGVMDKSQFLPWGKLASVVYGFARIRYAYRLLRSFYKNNVDADIYHLFEFEYIALFLYAILHPKDLRKTVLGFHTSDFTWMKGRPLPVNVYKATLSLLIPYVIRKAAAVTVHGHVLREKFIENLGLRGMTDKIHITGYGFDTKGEVVSQTVARQKLDIPQDHIYLLLFGMLRKSKGVIDVLKSFGRTDKRLMLLLAGSECDVSYREVNELIEKYDLEDRVVTHFKFIEENEIKYYFCASDIVLIPHKAGFLSFSGPLGLSVEFGKKVIASDVGEIGYFVRNARIGDVFEADNWDEFVRVVNEYYNQMLSDKQKRDEAFVETYTWEAIAGRINQLYSRLGSTR